MLPRRPPDAQEPEIIVIVGRSTSADPITASKLSLLERMIDKGALTLSIDKALWALAGIIAALTAPNALASLIQYLQHLA